MGESQSKMTGVTIYPSEQQATTINPSARSLVGGQNKSNFLQDVEGKKRHGTILQSSFHQTPKYLFPDDNGFVHTVMNAYNEHHHLRIRPEDIWLAILTQLSSYINAHSEELRGSFVAFDGKTELEIEYETGTRFDCNWAEFASMITHMLHQNVVDRELQSWIMPAFSTTIQHDKIVASVVMMASLQSYFNYTASFRCGLPSVTLLGEKADYELILQRLDKLRSFGKEPTQFADLLTAVIKRLVRSFEDPKDADVLDFWNRVVKESHFESGGDYFSGWSTSSESKIAF